MARPELAIKPGVRLNGAHFEPPVFRMLDVGRDTAPVFVDGKLWVTSGNDSKHSDGSKHYDDEAFDLRCWNIRSAEPTHQRWVTRTEARTLARVWVRDWQAELGADYDVILEEHWRVIRGARLLIPHIHGEYDPE